jgi:transcriptional regulator with XRE-family HTH domain
MWLDNLKELRKSSGMSLKQIADATKIPESTVKRIFAGDTDDPYVSTIHRIVIALGGSLDHILADTNAVLAKESLVEVKENADAAEAEKEMLMARLAELAAENAKLAAENEMLRMKIEHKDEIIALHNYYNKLKQNG